MAHYMALETRDLYPARAQIHQVSCELPSKLNKCDLSIILGGVERDKGDVAIEIHLCA